MYGNGPRHDFVEEEFIRRGGKHLEAALTKTVASSPIEALLNGGRYLAHYPDLLHACLIPYLALHDEGCEFALDLGVGATPAQVRVNTATEEVFIVATAHVGDVGARRVLEAVPSWATSESIRVTPGDRPDEVVAYAVAHYAPGNPAETVVTIADLLQHYLGELFVTAALEGVLDVTASATATAEDL